MFHVCVSLAIVSKTDLYFPAVLELGDAHKVRKMPYKRKYSAAVDKWPGLEVPLGQC